MPFLMCFKKNKNNLTKVFPYLVLVRLYTSFIIYGDYQGFLVHRRGQMMRLLILSIWWIARMNTFKKEGGLSIFLWRLLDILSNNLQKRLIYFIIFLQNMMVNSKNLCNQNLHKVHAKKPIFSYKDHFSINYLQIQHIFKNKALKSLNQFKTKNGKNIVWKNIISIGNLLKLIYLDLLLIFYCILKWNKLCLGIRLTIQ